MFVPTDPVDDGVAAYMSWQQMRELAAQGVFVQIAGPDRLDERTLSQYDAVVVMGWAGAGCIHNWPAGRFLASPGEPKRVVALVTSGDGDYVFPHDQIDAVSCASRPADSDQTAHLLAEKVAMILGL